MSIVQFTGNCKSNIVPSHYAIHVHVHICMLIHKHIDRERERERERGGGGGGGIKRGIPETTLKPC